jgi:superfamily I DNA/RNA helicase
MKVSPGDWRPRDIPDLEPAAWSALLAGTASVTAGPGAGKSEFLAQRASFLLETDLCPAPQKILAISFKRDAASNLRRRLQFRLPDHAERVTSMTFDAFTKSVVDRFKRLLPPQWALADGYRIGYSSQNEVRDFLEGLVAGSPVELRPGISRLRYTNFISNLVGSYPLPALPSQPSTAEEYAVQQWWKVKYQAYDVAVVDFIMLNRLAELIIRSSPQLQRALSATYPFVFVDEFQDTTYAQYAFLKSVFNRAGIAVTAVGDRKQRIMGWAGALQNAFAEFEADFEAESFELTWNFRSTRRLVELQHQFATRLDARSQLQLSKVDSSIGDPPVQLWSFSTSRVEAESIAAWIAADIDGSGRRPHDYAVIARQRVAELYPELADALNRQGLRLRNDDEQVGQLRLQDLLKDDLARLLVGIIRLAATQGGQPQTWLETVSTLAKVFDAEATREVGSDVDDALEQFIPELREWMLTTSLSRDEAEPGHTSALAKLLLDKLQGFLEYPRLAQRRLFADRPEDLALTVEAFLLRLTSVLERAQSWDQVAVAFADEDAVPLMTIHRSKGLEYHTVFFVGLDDDQWWAHARNTLESTMTFFVGMSRAAERLVFTQCDERGSTSNIADIYEVLGAADVPFVRVG